MIVAWLLQGTHTCLHHSITPREIYRASVTSGMCCTMSYQFILPQMHNMQPRGVLQPLHTQATRSDLDSGWELNVRPPHMRKRTSFFNYSSVILSIKWCKVLYINLRLLGLLMHLMWVLCDCMYWCKYEPLNQVCDSKREYARGRFNIFVQTLFFVSMRSASNMGSWQRCKVETVF